MIYVCIYVYVCACILFFNIHMRAKIERVPEKGETYGLKGLFSILNDKQMSNWSGVEHLLSLKK